MPGPVNPIRGPNRREILQRRMRPAYLTGRYDASKIRSVSRIAGAEHYCTYIPVFEFDADLRFSISDDFQRYNEDASTRFDWFVELNPQANPC